MEPVEEAIVRRCLRQMIGNGPSNIGSRRIIAARLMSLRTGITMSDAKSYLLARSVRSRIHNDLSEAALDILVSEKCKVISHFAETDAGVSKILTAMFKDYRSQTEVLLPSIDSIPPQTMIASQFTLDDIGHIDPVTDPPGHSPSVDAIQRAPSNQLQLPSLDLRRRSQPHSIMLSMGFFHRPQDRKIVTEEIAALGMETVNLLYGDFSLGSSSRARVKELMLQADAYLTAFDTQYVMTRTKDRLDAELEIEAELEEAVNAGLAIGLLIMEPTKSAPHRVADELALKEKELLSLVRKSGGSTSYVTLRRVPPSKYEDELYKSEIRALLRTLQHSLQQIGGNDPAVTLPLVPDQSPAPIRVEERDGCVALTNNRGSALNASPTDFNAWREPVLDHVQELLSGDFRLGTNHSHARDRLVALSTLFAGSIPDVKERQFRVGYEIERLEGLVVAYRSGADDLPVLNAAVLEDLDRLRVALVMGSGKLEKWSEFRRAAAADPLGEGTANPGVVSAAIDEMTAEMEAQGKYFDPELPRTFRFLAEATKDPVGATKTVVFGTVKSAENLLTFLGQRALGVGKTAANAAEQHITKAVAASLIVILSGAALRISGALPTAWVWLRPLLDALAKTGGG
jgi:hypothetical protein